ncbi:hypothetical protein [Frankia sp. CiP3]|uniref:hypothetical protein n=1 Tax=Frankia sp. CiP3 TaxID=2880971 RepID=UPI001EF70379|nr:hypothetical protein [Frankia sp. CiP3]
MVGASREGRGAAGDLVSVGLAASDAAPPGWRSIGPRSAGRGLFGAACRGCGGRRVSAWRFSVREGSARGVADSPGAVRAGPAAGLDAGLGAAGRPGAACREEAAAGSGRAPAPFESFAASASARPGAGRGVCWRSGPDRDGPLSPWPVDTAAAVVPAGASVR